MKFMTALIFNIIFALTLVHPSLATRYYNENTHTLVDDGNDDNAVVVVHRNGYTETAEMNGGSVGCEDATPRNGDNVIIHSDGTAEIVYGKFVGTKNHAGDDGSFINLCKDLRECRISPSEKPAALILGKSNGVTLFDNGDTTWHAIQGDTLPTPVPKLELKPLTPSLPNWEEYHGPAAPYGGYFLYD